MQKTKPYLLLAAIGLFALTYMVTTKKNNVPPPGKPLEQYASEITNECSTAEYKPLCYEQRIPPLLGEISLKDAFDVVREVRKLDSEYQFCHVLGHKLGGQEVAKDPDKWLDVLTACPADGICSNGCSHGAALERFNAAEFTDEQIVSALPDLQKVCEPREGYNPTSFDQATCYHGLGHLAAHIAGPDPLRGINICLRAVAANNGHHKQLCVGGVYMQYYQPLEPEDFALIDDLELKPTAANLKEYCKKYSSTAAEQGVCWAEAWPVMSKEIFSPHGFEKHCSYLTDPNQNQFCLNNLFSISGRRFLSDPEKVINLCSYVSSDQKKSDCHFVGALAAVEEDKTSASSQRLAISICEGAETQAVTEKCLGRLASSASYIFHDRSTELEQYCSLFPDQLKTLCLSR